MKPGSWGNSTSLREKKITWEISETCHEIKENTEITEGFFQI